MLKLTLSNMRHQNSFDFLRIILALCVIITHAYSLTGLPETDDPLYRLTGGCMSFATFTVPCFFAISGFLVVQSLQRSQHISDFFLKRIARIFPGLLVVLLLTVAFIWIAYPYGLKHYLHNPSVYSYISRNLLLLHQQIGIEGLFQNQPYPNVINGSLWTLTYEIAFYILLSIFFYIPFHLHRRLALLVCLACTALYILSFRYPHFANLEFFSLRADITVHLMSFFFCGAYLGTMSQFVDAQKRLIATTFLIIMLLSFSDKDYFISFQALILSPFIIALGCFSQPKWISRLLHRTGDISYGIYIYAFVTQQLLVYFFHFGHRKLILATSLISILLGLASWKLVESKALQQVRKKYSPQNFR